MGRYAVRGPQVRLVRGAAREEKRREEKRREEKRRDVQLTGLQALKGVVGASFGLDESQLRPWQRVSAGALYSPSVRADGGGAGAAASADLACAVTRARLFNALFTARVSTRCEMPPVHGTADVLAP